MVEKSDINEGAAKIIRIPREVPGNGVGRVGGKSDAVDQEKKVTERKLEDAIRRPSLNRDIAFDPGNIDVEAPRERMSVREATLEDIPEIMRVYNSRLYPRDLFRSLVSLDPSTDRDEILKIFDGLAGGGEIFTISAEDWKVRIQERRVMLALDSEGKITGVISYILPDTPENIALIAGRIERVQPLEMHKGIFERMKAEGYENTLMVEDAFFLKDARGITLQKAYEKILLHEMQRNPKSFTIEKIKKMYVFSWLACVTRIYPEGEQERKSFEFPDWNKASERSQRHARSRVIGSTLDDTSRNMVLPDIDGSDYLVDGKRVYLDVGAIDFLVELDRLAPRQAQTI